MGDIDLDASRALSGVPRRPGPLVTVLTPVRNGERHLRQCIESVLAQTYPHWEYVILDNQSTDATADIAAAYAKKDDRIRLHRTDAPLSAAANHNHAIRLMAPDSRYCKFLQADDWLFPECLARMVDLAESSPTVGIIGAYRLDGTNVTLDGLPYPSTVVPGRELGRATLLEQVYVFGSPTSIMIRSDLARARPVLFDEAAFPRHWDGPACLELLRVSDFGFVHQVLTFTRRPPEARTSLSRSLNSFWADKLVTLDRYGPVFLERDELDGRRRHEIRRYFRYLGRNLLRRDPGFWAYHQRTLAALGLRPGRLRLAAAAVGAGIEQMVYPLRAALRIATAKGSS